MAIIIQQPNIKPHSMCGVASQITSPCVSIPDGIIAEKDFCYCYWECDYKECVFGNDVLGFNNDKSSFMYRKLVSTDTIVIEIHKNGSLVHTVTDDSYGLYIDGFYLQSLYVGFIADWDLILTQWGAGDYTIVATSTLLGNVFVNTSRIFYLLPFSVEAANGTVRIEWWQNGNIEASQFDFTGLEWYQSMRIKASFVPVTPTLEIDRYLTASKRAASRRVGSRRATQIQASVVPNYELRTKLLPQEVSEYLLCDFVLANEIQITNANIFEKDYYKLKVKLDKIINLNTFAKNRRCDLEFGFSDRFENKVKRNEGALSGTAFSVPEASTEFQQLAPIGQISELVINTGVDAMFNISATNYLYTPLANPDTATFTICVNGEVVEVLTGLIGDNISSYNSTQVDPLLKFTGFISGTVNNGSTLTTEYQAWANINGYEISSPVSYVTIKYQVHEDSSGLSSIPDSTDLPYDEYIVDPYPLAKLPSQTFVGGTSGRIDLDVHLTEGDNITPLVVGDTVQINIYASEGGLLLETLDGTYGDDISTFTSSNFWPSMVDSYTLHSTGLVVHGGVIQYAKLDHATVSSSLSYKTFDASFSPHWVISAVDISTGLTSDNTDNFINVGFGYYEDDSHAIYASGNNTIYVTTIYEPDVDFGTIPSTVDYRWVQGTDIETPSAAVNTINEAVNHVNPSNHSSTNDFYVLAGSHSLRTLNSMQKLYRRENTAGYKMVRPELNGNAIVWVGDSNAEVTFAHQILYSGTDSGSTTSDNSKIYKGSTISVTYTGASDFDANITGGALLKDTTSGTEVLSENYIFNDWGIFSHKKEITTSSGDKIFSIIQVSIGKY